MNTILQKAAQQAAEVLKKYYVQELEYIEKGSHQNITTAADLESQQVLKETICELARSHGLPAQDTAFIAEEQGEQGQPKTHTFVVDPIDGTSNFSSGLDYFAISLAYFREGELVDGLVYAPIRDAWYWASKGKGAWKCHGGVTTKLQVKKQELKKSLMLTTISSRPKGIDAVTHILKHLYPKVKGARVFSTCSLDYSLFVENQFAIVLVGRAYIWDCAANKIIINEAGGTLYNWDGTPLTFELNQPLKSYSLLACHADHLPEIIPVLDKAREIQNS